MLLFLLLVAVVVVALLIMQARSSQAVPRVVLAPSAMPLATLATLAANRWHFCMPSQSFPVLSLRKWALGSNACQGCPPSPSPPLSFPSLDYLLSAAAAMAPVRSRSQSLLRVATCVINKNVWQSRRIYGMLASSTLTCRRH